MVPSYSVRVTRRASCSHDTRRPWRSRVLPLVLLDGLRKTLTAPVSSSHRMTRLFGISLQSRKRPSPNHTGPSAHRKPVASRSTAASGSRYGAKLGSSTWTAGSGYRTGLLGQRSMRLLSTSGMGSARSLAGHRHETLVEGSPPPDGWLDKPGIATVGLTSTPDQESAMSVTPKLLLEKD